MSTKKEVRVVEIETGKTVYTVDVTYHTPRGIEQVMRGMLINMNRDKFFVTDEPEPSHD